MRHEAEPGPEDKRPQPLRRRQMLPVTALSSPNGEVNMEGAASPVSPLMCCQSYWDRKRPTNYPKWFRHHFHGPASRPDKESSSPTTWEDPADVPRESFRGRSSGVECTAEAEPHWHSHVNPRHHRRGARVQGVGPADSLRELFHPAH